jgi:hypothetical protein
MEAMALPGLTFESTLLQLQLVGGNFTKIADIGSDLMKISSSASPMIIASGFSLSG